MLEKIKGIYSKFEDWAGEPIQACRGEILYSYLMLLLLVVI